MNSTGENKKIYFRVDCGGLIGFGHLARTQSIAQCFLEKNITPVFVIRKRPSLRELKIPYQIVWLPESVDVNSANPENWICGSQLSEAQDLLSMIEKGSMVFIDHYGLDSVFKNELKSKGMKLVGFQDVFHPEVLEDILINYQLGAPAHYTELLQKKLSTQFLLGPNYSPISLSFQNHRELSKTLREIKTIGIYFGGVPEELLLKFLAVMKASSFFKNKKIRWVVNSPFKAETEGLDLEFLSNLPTLIPLYESSDLVIGGCGVSYLERACMGIPQVIFLLADNQKEVSDYLKNHDLVLFAGDLRIMGHEDISSCFEKMDLEKLEENTSKSFHLIDGLGARRVVDKICEAI